VNDARRELARWERINRILRWVLFFNFLLVTGLLAYRLGHLRDAKQHQPDVKARVAELQAISDSLKRLSDYVSSQQEDLKTTAETLERLRSEKDRMEAALHIDRDQLRSLALLLDEQSRTSKWLDRALGFLLGTLSSILAAFIWERFRKPESPPSV
jgi:septal ring factor EnvC (AmiA/AmiB activator)